MNKIRDRNRQRWDVLGNTLQRTTAAVALAGLGLVGVETLAASSGPLGAVVREGIRCAETGFNGANDFLNETGAVVRYIHLSGFYHGPCLASLPGATPDSHDPVLPKGFQRCPATMGDGQETCTLPNGAILAFNPPTNNTVQEIGNGDTRVPLNPHHIGMIGVQGHELEIYANGSTVGFFIPKP